jgi:uncharacterized protein YndB with AHSA1/START domain
MQAVTEHLLSVSEKIRVAASPERVLDAWSGPLAIARWYVERRCGDPQLDQHFAWYEPRATSSDEAAARPRGVALAASPAVSPVRRLRFLSDGSAADASELHVTLGAAADGTLVTLEQRRFAAALQPRLPALAAGWRAALTLLKEYVERGADLPRCTTERDSAVVSAHAFAAAFASIDAVVAWAHDRPARLALATPHIAVLGFYGLPGLVCIHRGATHTVIAHTHWSDMLLPSAAVMVEQLATRFARIR